MADDVVAPVQYHPAWLAIAIALLVVAASGYAWALWTTRTRRAPAAAPPPSARDRAMIRRAWLERIDEVERGHARGELSRRAAHHALGAVLRGFVHDIGGGDVRAHTLAELARTDLSQVTAAVRIWYPTQFAPSPPADAADVDPFATARSVVSSWP